MSAGWSVPVVAVAALLVVWLIVWFVDRRDHRRFLTGQSMLGGPDAARAAGDAWRSLGGPPSIRMRSLGARVELGDQDPS